MLEAGQKFTLTTKEIMGTNEIASITYKELIHDISAGTTILIDDGLIEMTVEEITDTDIIWQCCKRRTGIQPQRGECARCGAVHALYQRV